MSDSRNHPHYSYAHSLRRALHFVSFSNCVIRFESSSLAEKRVRDWRLQPKNQTLASHVLARRATSSTLAKKPPKNWASRSTDGVSALSKGLYLSFWTDGSDGRHGVVRVGICTASLEVSSPLCTQYGSLPRRKERMMDDMICPFSSSMIYFRSLRAVNPSYPRDM